MRFLLHGEPGDRVDDAFREHGHSTMRPAELDLPDGAAPAQVLAACRQRQFELLTGSRAFLDIVLPGSGRADVFGRVLIFLQDRPGDHELAIHRLFDRYKRLAPGRLYTVTGGRVKVRQLPTGPSRTTPIVRPAGKD